MKEKTIAARVEFYNRKSNELVERQYGFLFVRRSILKVREKRLAAYMGKIEELIDSTMKQKKV